MLSLTLRLNDRVNIGDDGGFAVLTGSDRHTGVIYVGLRGMGDGYDGVVKIHVGGRVNVRGDVHIKCLHVEDRRAVLGFEAHKSIPIVRANAHKKTKQGNRPGK